MKRILHLTFTLLLLLLATATHADGGQRAKRPVHVLHYKLWKFVHWKQLERKGGIVDQRLRRGGAKLFLKQFKKR